MERDRLDLKALGQAITTRREELGWNTHRLSEKTGIGDAYLRKLEAGKASRIGIDVIGRLARALGVNAEDLLHPAGLPTGKTFRRDLHGLFDLLGNPERTALLRAALTLRQLQQDYAVLQEGPAHEPRFRLIAEPKAGYDREMPIIEEWPPVDEPPEDEPEAQEEGD